MPLLSFLSRDRRGEKRGHLSAIKKCTKQDARNPYNSFQLLSNRSYCARFQSFLFFPSPLLLFSLRVTALRLSERQKENPEQSEGGRRNGLADKDSKASLCVEVYCNIIWREGGRRFVSCARMKTGRIRPSPSFAMGPDFKRGAMEEDAIGSGKTIPFA